MANDYNGDECGVCLNLFISGDLIIVMDMQDLSNNYIKQKVHKNQLLLFLLKSNILLNTFKFISIYTNCCLSLYCNYILIV